MDTGVLSSMRSRNRHTIIVGGGVIGVCCAYFLAKRGARVTVLERDQIGKGASYGNAGSIAPGHPPINKPGRVRQALKSLFDPLSPLYVAPRPDPALAKWLWAFRRTCTDRHVELCMRTLAPLGHATRELFDELVETENLECCFHRAGYSEIYLTERGLESARKEASVISRYGFHPEVMPGGALRECEPAINGRVVGGIFHPEAATINPYHFVLEMAKRAERYGAELRTGTQVVALRTMDRKVRGVQTQNGELMEADSVVVAGGGCLQHAAHPGAWRKLPFAAGEGLSPRLRIRGGQASASAARLRARGEHGILHTHGRVCALRRDTRVLGGESRDQAPASGTAHERVQSIFDNHG